MGLAEDVAVGHGNDSAGAECDADGAVNTAGAIPTWSDPTVERAVGVEDLDAARVGHGHGPAGAEGDVAGTVKRAVARPCRSVFRSELEVERAVGVEDLDAVVGRVGHGHGPVGAEGDAVGSADVA